MQLQSVQEDYMTWKCKSIRGKIRNKEIFEIKEILMQE